MLFYSGNYNGLITWYGYCLDNPTSRIESFGYIPVWFSGRGDFDYKIPWDRSGQACGDACAVFFSPTDRKERASERQAHGFQGAAHARYVTLKNPRITAWQSVPLFLNRPQTSRRRQQ